MTLDGLKVLYRPHAARHGVLDALVMAGRERRGWRVGIVSEAASPGQHAKLLSSPAEFFSLPELGRPAAWEASSSAAAEVRTMVRECEQAAALPLNRITLAGERVLGRAYGREFYHWPSYSLSRQVLSDNEGPARAVERLFAYIRDVLDQFKPDLVLSGNFAAPEMIVLHMLCARRQVPCWVTRPSKILSDRSFWTDDRRMANAAAASGCRQRVSSGEPASDRAAAFLAKFRDQPATVAYIQNNWDNASTSWRRHRDLAVQGMLNLRHLIRGQSGSESKPVWGRFLEMYRQAYLKRRQRRFYRRIEDEELKAKPYLYLALHKEPELALNVQHAEWHSQKHLIAWLSANLPAGYRLLVRDHRFNVGRRPTRYYDDIRRYPGVTLLDPLDAQFKYIRNAALIVTDNGTTGWEGLIFGRPVIVLGENYYSATGLAPVVEAAGQLGSAILHALYRQERIAASERDRRLGALIDAEFETSISDDDVDGQLGALAARLSASDRAPLSRPQARA